MTNEEFQRIVLEKLENLETGQGRLEERQGRLDERQGRLEKEIKEIRREQKFMWEDIKKIDSRLDKQEEKIKAIAK